MKILNVRKRLASLNEPKHINRCPINITSAYDKALSTGSTHLIETVIENWRELNQNTNIAFTQVITLFDKYTETANDMEITKIANYIVEEIVPTVQDSSKARERIKYRIEKIKNGIRELKKATRPDPEATSPTASPVATGSSDTTDFQSDDTVAANPAVAEAYENIYNQCESMRICDRVIDNYNKLSKRFNIDKIIGERVDNNKNVYDIVIELCSFVDTYKIADYIKFNTIIESALYVLDKYTSDYNRKDIVNAATDYFLMNGTFTESYDKDAFLKAAKSILEDNKFYSDLLTDKNDSKIKKNHVDIQFDYFFNSDNINYSSPIFTDKQEIELELMDESSEICEEILSEKSEDLEVSVSYKTAELDSENVNTKDADPELTYIGLFDTEDQTFSSKIFDSEFEEAEMEIMSEANTDIVFDTFFDREDDNFSLSLVSFDDDEDDDIYIMESYVNVVDNPKLANMKSKAIIPPKEMDDEMYDYHTKKMLKKKLTPIQDEDNIILQGALALKKMFIQKGSECNILKYHYEKDNKYVYVMSIVKPKKDNKFEYSYAIIAKDESKISRVYLYYIYYSHNTKVIGMTDHFTFKFKSIKEEATDTIIDKTLTNNAINMINEFKKNPINSEQQISLLIESIFSLCTKDDIILSVSSFLHMIYTFYIDNDIINANKDILISILIDYTDKLLSLSLTENDYNLLRDSFAKENNYIETEKDTIENNHYKKFVDYLKSSIVKIEEFIILDKESDRVEYDVSKEDFESAVDVITTMENDIHYLKDTNLDIILDDMDKCLPDMTLDNIDDITNYSIKNPEIIEPTKLQEMFTKHINKLRTSNDLNKYLKIDCLNENIYKIKNRIEIKDIEFSIEESIYNFTNSIDGLKNIQELLKMYKETNPIVMNELSFTNTLKLVSEKIRKSMIKLSDKEKQISQNIDGSVANLKRGIEKSLTTDNREAVIKGSILPPLSKIIKAAILAGATAIFINPAIAIIGVVGSIAVSKKFKAKERQLVLDDIEIELKMVDKYLKIAEDKEDLQATKQLLRLKKSLERQKNRLRYKMKFEYNQKVPNPEPSDYED